MDSSRAGNDERTDVDLTTGEDPGLGDQSRTEQTIEGTTPISVQSKMTRIVEEQELEDSALQEVGIQAKTRTECRRQANEIKEKFRKIREANPQFQEDPNVMLQLSALDKRYMALMTHLEQEPNAAENSHEAIHLKAEKETNQSVSLPSSRTQARPSRRDLERSGSGTCANQIFSEVEVPYFGFYPRNTGTRLDDSKLAIASGKHRFCGNQADSIFGDTPEVEFGTVD